MPLSSFDIPLKSKLRITPEFPRAPLSIADAVSAATSPTQSLSVERRSFTALQIVIDIFEPVSPSGTGNTLRSFIVSALFVIDAPALNTILLKVEPVIKLLVTVFSATI